MEVCMNKNIIAMLLYFLAALLFLLYVFIKTPTILAGCIILIIAVIYSRMNKKIFLKKMTIPSQELSSFNEFNKTL